VFNPPKLHHQRHAVLTPSASYFIIISLDRVSALRGMQKILETISKLQGMTVEKLQ
jgi:hypothetical protein